MYWRIRKIGPEQIARQYGVHAVLIVSVLFNLFLFTKVNASKAMSSTMKLDYDKFCRQVTSHIFDASYLTTAESLAALENECHGPVIAAFRQRGLLPQNVEELKTIVRQLDESKSVSCVRFDKVSVGDPNKQGFLPVTVMGQVVIHDAAGVRPTAFSIRYMVGTSTNPKTNEQKPIILGYQEIRPDQATP